MSWRDLPPVEENVPPRDKASQTLLARQSVCPRSAYLYLRHDGGVGSHEMHRGSAFHKFAERVVLELIDRGEPRMPWEVAKDLMAEVVADHPDWVIPPHEMDHLRLMAFHFADTFVVDPERVVAVEKLFELEVGGFRVRGKVDLALRLDDGGVAVRDYKTSPALPTQEQIDAAFQLPLYALLVGEGQPVAEEPCGACDGRGRTPIVRNGIEGSVRLCSACDGKGRIETFEPRIGERFTWFDLSEVYPRLEPWDENNGKVLAHRDRQMSRHELVDHRLYVEGLVAKLAHGLGSGEWPAIPDPDGHCNTCAAPFECPIPPHLRGHVDAPIRSLQHAEDVGLHLAFTEKENRQLKAELRQYAKANDVAIPCGPNQAWDFVVRESEGWVTGKKIGRPTTADAKQAFQAAVARAASTGEPFDYAEYRKVSRSTNFEKRKLSADETLTERLEASLNGSPSDAPGGATQGQGASKAPVAPGTNPLTGNGRSRDETEADRDALYGAEPPY